MVPRISVLGHMLIVAILSYLFSLEINACRKRCINNYFTGLFHDLPEILTRDIIDPVKKSVVGLTRLIKTYENKEMKERIYKLIPKTWHSEIKMFTKDEFMNTVVLNDITVIKDSGEISKKFNEDKFNPRDGELVEATDNLTAFIEAYQALKNGITSQELLNARDSLGKKYKGKTISGIKFGEIYADFE
jgi:putative hydrolase of HD superfamily